MRCVPSDSQVMPAQAHPFARAALPLTAIFFVFPFQLAFAAELGTNGLRSGGSTLEVDYNRHIRPLLADNCFECHGPDSGARKASLRLDQRVEAIAERDGVRAIVPGDPQASALVRRITHPDPDERMPPEDTNKQLSQEDIALLKTWISGGANYAQHWSYLPPERPELPDVKSKVWPRNANANAIDRFILHRLEQEGLEPSREADRRTLIRRLSFDLIGLPPTPQEVKTFVNDDKSNAYENVVDRLLASPQYGERLAVYWLDLVRYADTAGYHGDQDWNIWPYRDFVINAFNDNMPFDQFTAEQLAGDLLPNASLRSKVASGYNRLHQVTREGGAQAKEYLAIYAADRVRTASTIWLGSTLGCAQCHDHKFDPFTSKDFYRFAAFFADIEQVGVYNVRPRGGRLKNTDPFPPEMSVPSSEQRAEVERLEATTSDAQKPYNTLPSRLKPAFKTWQRESLAQVVENVRPVYGPWHVIGPFKAANFDKAHNTKFGPEGRINLKKKYSGGKLKWEKRPQWKDGKIHKLTGNNSATYLYRTVECAADMSVTLSLGSDDSIRVWVNRKQVLNKKVLRGVAPDQEKITVAFRKGRNDLLMKIVNGVGEYGFYFKQIKSGPPDDILAALRVAPDKRSDKLQAALWTHYRDTATHPDLVAFRKKVARLKKKIEKLKKAIPVTMITVAVKPRKTRVLPRGNWMDDSGEVVQPGVPHFLRQIQNGLDEGQRATRLDLARWITSRDNPLAARTFVNRLWKLYFSRGISSILDDLGTRGKWPTHPDLLDWLAVEFMDSGWDIKHMVRLIVTSSAYRQSSTPTHAQRERDPYNLLLSRQARFRLEAEFIRDNALALSGLLVLKLGGPSVKPYQPEGYYMHLNFPKRKYQASKGPDQYRRGLYMHWQRTFLQPMLVAFDAATRQECTVERRPSNTPLQALTLLNDPTFVEATRVLAERAMRGSEAMPDRMEWIFQRSLQRQPAPKERGILENLLRKHLAHYRANVGAAEQLIRVGQAPTPEDLDAAELAAWTSVARVVLNLRETITRY